MLDRPGRCANGAVNTAWLLGQPGRITAQTYLTGNRKLAHCLQARSAALTTLTTTKTAIKILCMWTEKGGGAQRGWC